jgi:hypothetical protein
MNYFTAMSHLRPLTCILEAGESSFPTQELTALSTNQTAIDRLRFKCRKALGPVLTSETATAATAQAKPTL